jgi:hypothetical protein
MWIFTSDGFVSIVADRDSDDKLLVRGRSPDHIRSLFPKAKVFTLDLADYRYRALLSRKTVAQVLAKKAAGIRYDNFKSTVTDPAYHGACMQVWSTVNRLQQVEALAADSD